MPERFSVLLDQNVPIPVEIWLQKLKPDWVVQHVSKIGLSGQTDEEIFKWAQNRKAIIITFDEDFADQRSFPVGNHSGIIRLKIWPTTIEETQNALQRLLNEIAEADLKRSLVIIDRNKIRIRTL